MGWCVARQRPSCTRVLHQEGVRWDAGREERPCCWAAEEEDSCGYGQRTGHQDLGTTPSILHFILTAMGKNESFSQIIIFFLTKLEEQLPGTQQKRAAHSGRPYCHAAFMRTGWFYTVLQGFTAFPWASPFPDTQETPCKYLQLWFAVTGLVQWFSNLNVHQIAWRVLLYPTLECPLSTNMGLEVSVSKVFLLFWSEDTILRISGLVELPTSEGTGVCPWLSDCMDMVQQLSFLPLSSVR